MMKSSDPPLDLGVPIRRLPTAISGRVAWGPTEPCPDWPSRNPIRPDDCQPDGGQEQRLAGLRVSQEAVRFEPGKR